MSLSDMERLIERLTKIAVAGKDVSVAKEAINMLTCYGQAAVPSLFTIVDEAESNVIKWVALRRIHEIVECESIQRK